MAPDPLEALARCRESIDELDRRLVDLLNARTEIAGKIGSIKQKAQMPIYEPKREEQVFENVTSHNRGPLTAEGVKRIFERIIDEMRRVQRDGRETEG